jgi:hypothetical protein
MSRRFLASVDGELVLMDDEMNWPNFPSMEKRQAERPPSCDCKDFCGVGIGAHPAGRCKGLPMDAPDAYNARQSA